MNQPGGAPVNLVSGKAKERLNEAGITTIEVSLSHSEQYAIAMVCIQKAENDQLKK
jgi:phosphopantetheinyl transferase (holo-ACP synthase)